MAKQIPVAGRSGYWEHAVLSSRVTVLRVFWTRKGKPLLILQAKDLRRVKIFLHSRKVVGQLLHRLGMRSHDFYYYWKITDNKATMELLNTKLQKTKTVLVFKGQAPDKKGETWVWAVTSPKHKTIASSKFKAELKRHAPKHWFVESYSGRKKSDQKMYFITNKERFRVSDKLFEMVISVWAGKNNTRKAVKVTPMLRILPEDTFVMSPHFFRVKHYSNWSEKLGLSIGRSIKLAHNMKHTIQRAFKTSLTLKVLLELAEAELSLLEGLSNETYNALWQALRKEVTYEHRRNNLFVLVQSFARVGSYPKRYSLQAVVDQALKHQLCVSALLVAQRNLPEALSSQETI